jgi:hypothetical protein
MKWKECECGASYAIAETFDGHLLIVTEDNKYPAEYDYNGNPITPECPECLQTLDN